VVGRLPAGPLVGVSCVPGLCWPGDTPPDPYDVDVEMGLGGEVGTVVFGPPFGFDDITGPPPMLVGLLLPPAPDGVLPIGEAGVIKLGIGLVA
jgi:hypothetical protein